MSQSTRLYTVISYLDKNYNSKAEVENDLENVRKQITDLKQNITLLAMMTEPNKFVPNGWQPMDYITYNVNGILENLQELYINEWKLELLLELWDECHTQDGLGKYPPEAAQHTYIDGSFVFTDKYPTKEALLA